jgi:YidC/Oxa1 family membrane protein insertase
MTTIENRRFALLAAGAAVLFFLYQAWEKDFGEAHKSAPTATATPAAPLDETPEPGDEPPAPSAAAPTAAKAGASTPPPDAAQRITVQTDVLTVVLSAQGGDLRKAELIGYPFTKKEPGHNVDLLDDQPDRWFVVQSGLTGAAGTIVSHKDLYRAATNHYTLGEGEDQLEVPLEFVDAEGRHITKTYRFKRGSYVIDLNQRIVNGAAAPLTANPYVQLWNAPYPAGEEPRFTQTFTGLGVYEQKNGGSSYRFRKVDFKDLAGEPLKLEQSGGWLSMLQHYFFVAVIPPQGDKVTYVAKPSSSKGFLAQYIGAAAEVPTQGQHDFAAQLYVGPKLQQKLAGIAPGLELTVDYGLLTPVAQPLFWLLDWFHKLTRNWGFAIILLTLAVKGALFKLSEAQFRSMAKMKKYAPRIQELKDRHGEDRERMNKALMELYKKEKFNPLAGCWPILIQFPVFIALYWVLLESVELRQASFALWLNDLSSADPYFVLPALFAISMYVQQKMSGNVSMDPMQQRVMGLMPWMMGVFFAFFPAGLVLYWVVSNLIGITQQWYIQHKLTKEGLRH